MLELFKLNILPPRDIPVPVKVEYRETKFVIRMQQRLLFIEQYEQGTNAYHIPIVLELSDRLDKTLLKEALLHIMDRHEVLRTCFKTNEEGMDYQEVMKRPFIFYDNIDHKYNESSFKQALNHDINRVFNLREDYPIRIVFYDVVVDAAITVHAVAASLFEGRTLYENVAK